MRPILAKSDLCPSLTPETLDAEHHKSAVIVMFSELIGVASVQQGTSERSISSALCTTDIHEATRSKLEVYGMADHSVHRASDLAGDERLIIERWLGRTLSDSETISISAYRPHTAPDSAKRETLRQSIIAQAREIGSRGGDTSDQEIDNLLSEAFDDIRARRQ